ncbi:MAG: AAA family ATPase [Corynebacterium sp.]|uniref:AAA family ATPase n=1 Tax=Corynebacterium sp. TaxID=1720 RepID=UPI003F9ACB47
MSSGNTITAVVKMTKATTTTADLATALGVPHLRVTDKGIHLGASGLAEMWGTTEDLKAAGHTMNYPDPLKPGHGTAMYAVGDAVDIGTKVGVRDPATGLYLYAGNRCVPVPNLSTVLEPVGGPDTAKSKRVATMARTAANRKRPPRGRNDPVLCDEVQAMLDGGELTYDVAVGLQRDLNKEAKDAARAKLSRATAEVRYTEGSRRRLYRGQSDMAKVNKELAAGGDLIEPATFLSGLGYGEATNGISGPSSSGKSWVGLEALRQVLVMGHPALLIDYEDHEAAIARRMRALGCGKYLEREQFLRIEPEVENGKVADIDQVLEDWGQFKAIVVDGISKALGAAGVDDNSATAYTKWESENLAPLARTSASVWSIDHTGKGANTKGGAEALGTVQKRAQVSGAAYTVHPITAPRPGGVGSFALYLTKDKRGDVIRRADPETNYVGKMEIDSRPWDELATNDKDVSTIVRFIPYNPEKDTPVTPADLMPALDAALHDVFPEDEVPHQVNGKRNPALPTLGELMWIVTSALTAGGEDDHGLTQVQLYDRLRELAPETVTGVKPSKLDERLSTQMKPGGYLRRKGARILPREDRVPSKRKVPEVLEALLEHQGSREDLEDETDTPAAD